MRWLRRVQVRNDFGSIFRPDKPGPGGNIWELWTLSLCCRRTDCALLSEQSECQSVSGKNLILKRRL